MLQIDAVVLGDLMREIGQQRNVDVAETALLAWRIHPGQVGELAVGADADHLGIEVLELGGTVAERNDLGGTHECKVERVEQQDEVLAKVVG